jgi:nicotinamide-nucleotide amidase
VCWSVKLADGRGVTRTVRLPGDRSDIRDRSTTVAMHLLRRVLAEPAVAPSGAAAAAREQR